MQSVQTAASEIRVTLIFCVIMYLFRGELKQKKVTKILMIVCIARLVRDAISWAFDGTPGIFWGDSNTGQYDLVLMDIQMPMMNGYKATKRIRAMESTYCRQVPIIAMTANAFEEDKALALQAEMNDYIAKPIQIDKMLKVISKVLECNH